MKLPSRLARFIRELRRRRVLQAAAVYATGAFVAVQVAAAVLPALPLPPWTHTLVVVVAVAGFPVVVVLWWAFEITPEGIRRTVEREERAEVVQARGTPWVALALVVVVTVASGALGWTAWGLWLDPAAGGEPDGGPSESRSRRPSRVAVLPFEDGSADGSLERVAAGLSRDLTHHLSQVDVLDMVSSLGTRAYAQSDLSPDSIAHILGAGSLVTGTLEPVGGRVRLRIQLVDGASGETRLSSELSAPRDSVIPLRDDLVAEAVRQLQRQLGEQIELERIRGSTPSGAAWEAFHEAEGVVQTADSLRHYGAIELARSFYDRADALYLEATGLDDDWIAPRLARGWLAYKRARLRGPRIDQTDPEWLRVGIGIAGGILSDRPGNAAALELRGVLRSWLCQAGAVDSLQRTRRHAEEDLNAAVTQDRDRARAWAELAEVLRAQGRFEEARTAWNEARETDAFLRNDTDVLRLGSHLALELGDLETALDWVETGQRRYPNSANYPQLQLLIYPMEGAPRVSADSVWSVLREFEERVGSEQPYAHVWVAAALARFGLADSARSVLDRILAETEEGNRPNVAYFAPKVWLNLGDTARALRGLHEALSYGYWADRKSYVAEDIWWKPLHGDTTFQALVADGS